MTGDRSKDLPSAAQSARDLERAASLVRPPDGVVGRADVLACLDRSLESVAESGRRFVLLEGDSGVGKSTVVREMRRRVFASGGLVAGGEFGANARRGSSSGLRGAVSDVVTTMLGAPDDELQEWLFGLREALGGPVEQIADLIPEFGMLSVGEPSTLGSSPTALRNRLRLAVLAVVRATAQQTRPLLITLDDFDRADVESMQVVYDAVTGDADGLLVLATATPGALAGQPLFDDPSSQRVHLDEFDYEALETFVARSLGSSSDEIRDLAGLTWKRVGANPLAVLEYLQRAVAVGALSRPTPTAAWSWSESQLEALDPAVSERDIATSILRDVEGADLLEIAACLGDSFTISDLSRAAGRPSDEVAEAVLRGLDRGILRRRGATETTGSFLDPQDSYAFAHEHVADAVRSTLSLKAQSEAHARIGRALLESEAADDLIVAARHMNAAAIGLGAAVDRMELADLNRRAARRARQTAAFELALELARAGLACLPADGDDLDHLLVLDLHLLGAEAAWITGDLALMASLLSAARTLKCTTLDHAEIAFLEMKGLAAAEHSAEAVAVGRAALEELGVRFPARPRRTHTLRELVGVRRRLRGRSDEQLLMLPQASDAEALATQKLLAEMFGPAYMVEPDLWPLLALRCLRLTLDAGRAPVSPVAFAGYGLLLGLMGRYEEAKRFGDLAMTMAEQPDCREFRSWTCFIFYDFIYHWTRAAAEAIEPLRGAIREALLIGDLENAGYMTAVELYQSLHYGIALPEIDARGAELSVYLRPYGAQFRLCESTRQLVQNLMARAPDPFELVGDTAYNERTALPTAVAHRDVTALSSYHLTKLALYFMLGDFRGAVYHAQESERFLRGVGGTPNVPIFHWANSIVRLRTAPGQRATRRALRHARRGFRTWRKTSPENYEAFSLLVEAEAERAAGHSRRAEDLYDEAVTVADRSGLVIAGAIAREYCGDLHAQQGRDRVASAYLNSAIEAWTSLGGDAKVEQLRADYPKLLHSPGTVRSDPDPRSLVELRDAIVGEIGLDELVMRLLSTVAHLTDAERGVLLVDEDGTLLPRAVLEQGALEPARLNADQGYAESVVRYVERSHRPVLIPDINASVHARDRHLRATGVRSVLCLPLTRGGVQLALVYLESRSLGAFTPAHLNMLRTMSVQLATELENAQLAHRLAEVQRRHTDLVSAQSRFVPEQLLRELGRETLFATDTGDAVAREMTLLYSDIRGYTDIQEGLDPRHGIGFLNDYLERMEPPILAHGGFVVQYLGDGIVALFGQSSDGALRAALAMRRVEREVAEQRRWRGLEPVYTGVAVHTGRVVIGTYGGVNQIRCGVVGDAVNLAARIEGLTRDHASLLISDSTYARLEDPSAYDLRRVGRFRVVGRITPVTAWEAFDEDDPDVRSAKRTALRTHDAALVAFEAGRMDEARRGFEEVAHVVPGDRVAARYVERCQEFLARGVPDDWDGVVTLDHK
jgi:predicted ATPase/class 3 adenylate cyclase